MNIFTTCNGSVKRAAGVGVDETACTHRTLDVADVKTALTKHRTLLITNLCQYQHTALIQTILSYLTVWTIMSRI